MRKIGFTLFIFVCVLLFHPSISDAQSNYDVPIDSEYFPDEVFIEHIQTNFDLDKDGILSKNELDKATTIYFKEDMYGATNRNDTVQTLQGIDYFYNLSNLILRGHEYMYNLDLSQNEKLEKLVFISGNLQEVKLPNSPSLKEIDLFDNSLRKLDLSGCKNLTKLSLDMNDFEEINLSKLKKLKHLTLANNYLSSIDLSSNTELNYLELEHNRLRVIDLSNNPSLQSLDISGNSIDSFDAKGFNYLDEIFSDKSTDVTIYYSSKNEENATTNFKGYCIPNISIELHGNFTYDSKGNVVVDLSKILSSNLLMEFWEMQDNFDNDTPYPKLLTIPFDEINEKFIKTYTFKVDSSKKEWTFYLKNPRTTETSTSSTEDSSSTKPSSSSTESSSSTKPSTSSTEDSSSTKTSSSSMEESSSTKPSTPHYIVEIPELTVPRYGDYKQAIKKKVSIKNATGDVIPLSSLNYSITSSGNITNKLGEVSAVFTLTYRDGTKSMTKVKINVVSGIEVKQPDIAHMFYVGFDEKDFDPYQLFSAFEIGNNGKKTKLGKYDPSTKVGVEVIENPVDFTKGGDYTLRYRITNSLGEQTEYKYTVTVKGKLKLTVFDKKMFVGDKLTKDMILEWAQVENADTTEFEVIGNEIPVNQLTDTLTTAGVYTVRFIARQDSGERAEATMKLIVNERPTMGQPVTTPIQPVSSSKVLANTATTKATLPKTGSEQAKYVFSLIGFVLVSFIAIVKLRKGITE